MNNKTKTIKEIPIEGKPNHYYKVTLFYSKGGCNYFSATRDERGYYLAVKPVEKSQQNGYTSESYVLFSGVKKLVQTANRFSQKVLDSLAGSNYDEVIAKFVQHIEPKNQQVAV